MLIKSGSKTLFLNGFASPFLVKTLLLNRPRTVPFFDCTRQYRKRSRGWLLTLKISLAFRGRNGRKKHTKTERPFCFYLTFFDKCADAANPQYFDDKVFSF